MKKQIGLFFGSFNPIHHGHLILASYIVEETDLSEIWFVVSPQNPLKTNSSLLNEQHRLGLVKLAIEDDKRLRASNIEFSMPRPSYTIDTLIYLEEKYPKYSFTVIMGADSYLNLTKWKNAEQIINNYNILIYPRPGFAVEIKTPSHTLINAPLLEISATMIRNNIRNRKSLRYLVPEKVMQEMEAHGYYRSGSENPSQ